MASNYIDYLKTCEDKREIHSFETQEEADIFGEKLRNNLCEEFDCGYYELDYFVDVKISRRTVRIEAITAKVCETISQ